VNRIAPVRVIAILLLPLMSGLAGCLTTGYEGDEYSDLPWNTPAEWEGTTSIPGLSGYER
jgi:hypothetical protein